MKKFRIYSSAVLAAMLLLSVVSTKAQSFSFGFDNDCGTWEAKPTYYTDWQNVDTLKNKPIKDTVRNWIYDAEKMVVSNMTTLAYCPCGCGYDTKWQQYRVCQITGIRQLRYKIQSYEYKPKPKSDYQRAVDSLSKNNN